MSTFSDEQNDLIARAKKGESAAFRRLVESHAVRLLRCARALSRDCHWAEDLAQETFVEAWKSLARFDGRCQFSTWLYGILRHRFLKGRRFQEASRLPPVEDPGLSPEDAQTPYRAAVASEDAQRVRQAVECLPEEHRLVVELRFFAGATLNEIAATLGCPLGTVKSRLHHALEKLRQMNIAVNLFDSRRESKESQL